MTRATLLRFPGPYRERQAATLVALASVPGGVVEPLPTLRHVARPLRQRVTVYDAPTPRAVLMWPEMGAPSFVPRNGVSRTSLSTASLRQEARFGIGGMPLTSAVRY